MSSQLPKPHHNLFRVNGVSNRLLISRVKDSTNDVAQRIEGFLVNLETLLMVYQSIDDVVQLTVVVNTKLEKVILQIQH